MLEFESGAVSDDGAEGEGGCDHAGVESDGSAFFGFLFVLEAVVASRRVKCARGTIKVFSEVARFRNCGGSIVIPTHLSKKL